MKIPRKIFHMTMIILGFVVAIFLGIMAGRLFGTKVVVDGKFHGNCSGQQ